MATAAMGEAPASASTEVEDTTALDDMFDILVDWEEHGQTVEHLTPHPKAGLTEEQAPQASAGHENSRKRSVSLEEPTSSLGMRDRARQFETDERTHKQQRTQKRFRDEWDLDSNAESSTPSTEEVEP